MYSVCNDFDLIEFLQPFKLYNEQNCAGVCNVLNLCSL